MSLLTLSVLIGIMVGGFFTFLLVISKKYVANVNGAPLQLIPLALVLGLCAGLYTSISVYRINGMNSTPLSYWKDFDKIELIDVDLNGAIGDRYEFHVTYDGEPYEVTINYECEGPFEREDMDLFIKNYYGEIEYSLWGSRVDHNDWLKVKSMFVDKFTEKEIKSVEETEEPIEKLFNKN